MIPEEDKILRGVVPYILKLSLIVLLVALVIRWIESIASTFPIARTLEMRSPGMWTWLIIWGGTVLNLVLGLWQPRNHYSGRSWIRITQLIIASLCLLGICVFPLFMRLRNGGNKSEIWSLNGPAYGAFTTSVFFANGGSTPNPGDVRRLQKRAAQFGDCNVVAVNINGLVSSAEYRKDNEKRNLDLACRRVKAVQSAMPWRVAPQIVAWSSLSDMSNSAVFYIDRVNGLRQPDREALNRRVDVTWKVENCNVDPQNAPARGSVVQK